MGDLTKNFSRKEFSCKCGCGFDTIDFQIIEALQHLADRYSAATNKKVVVNINCGCRCKVHNDSLRELYIKTDGKQGENTAKDSQHIYGRAADISVFIDSVKIDPSEISEFFKNNYSKFGIGSYSTFTHIDCRTNGPARW